MESFDLIKNQSAHSIHSEILFIYLDWQGNIFILYAGGSENFVEKIKQCALRAIKILISLKLTRNLLYVYEEHQPKNFF